MDIYFTRFIFCFFVSSFLSFIDFLSGYTCDMIGVRSWGARNFTRNCRCDIGERNLMQRCLTPLLMIHTFAFYGHRWGTVRFRAVLSMKFEEFLCCDENRNQCSDSMWPHDSIEPEPPSKRSERSPCLAFWEGRL
jgi:hypothetical protein